MAAGAILRQMTRLKKIMDKDPKKIVGGKRAGKKRVKELEEMRTPPKESKKTTRDSRKKRKEEYENTIDMLTGNYKKGGMVKKCKRDGICKKGKTKGRMI